MANRVTKDNLFKAVPHSPVTKSEITKKISQDLVKVEADARRAKTDKLRKARLEMEARQAAETEVKTRKKPSRKASAKT